MTYLNHKLIRECLCELADKDAQERLWTASSGEVSSLTEATCQLFNDSGLDLALEGKSAYGQSTDILLNRLRALLRDVSIDRPPIQTIQDPKMIDVRILASQILNQLPVIR